MIPSDIQILKKVRQTIEKYNLFEPGDKIIVAVSGGADSVCLLNILNSLKKDLNISIHIAHLNHLLREKESERDAEFVRETAELLLLPFTIEKRDIKALKKKLKTSTQAAAVAQAGSFGLSGWISIALALIAAFGLGYFAGTRRVLG